MIIKENKWHNKNINKTNLFKKEFQLNMKEIQKEIDIYYRCKNKHTKKKLDKLNKQLNKININMKIMLII